jgi:hypothetical protein
LLGLGLELVWCFGISPRQTAINVALGAMTEVFWETARSDPDFWRRAKDAICRECGAESAEGLDDLITGG